MHGASTRNRRPVWHMRCCVGRSLRAVGPPPYRHGLRPRLGLRGVHVEMPAAEVVEAERDRTHAHLSRFTHLSDALRSELLQLSHDERMHPETPPEIVKDHAYYVLEPPEQRFPLYCRRRVRPSMGPNEVLIDQNAEGKGWPYIGIEQMEVSPDGAYLAYTVDRLGDERPQLRIKHLPTGLVDDPSSLLGDAVMTMAWDPNGTGIFYATADAGIRPNKLYHWNMTTRACTLVHEEHDDAFVVSVNRSKDGAFVVLNVHSKATSEVHLLRHDATSDSVVANMVEHRCNGVQYFVEHQGGRLIVQTNAGRHDGSFALVHTRDMQRLDRSHWLPLYDPHTRDTREGRSTLVDMDVFRAHIVTLETCLDLGVPLLRLHRVAAQQHPRTPNPGLESRTVRLPWRLCHVEPAVNADPDASAYRFTVSLPTHPGHTMEANLDTGQLFRLQVDPSHEQCLIREPFLEGTSFLGATNEVIMRPQDDDDDDAPPPPPQPRPSGATPVPSLPLDDAASWLPRDCTTVRTWAPASPQRDPAVPITLVLPPGGGAPDAPVLVSVYGAYGHVQSLHFRASVVPLLRRGWKLAFAHVRGGSELGALWHRDATGRHKGRSAHDLARVVHHLARDPGTAITRPGRVVGYASSAGAIALAGAVMRDPRVWGAMVLWSPFVDVLSTLQDASDALTSHEHDELGDPLTQPDVATAMAAYCPTAGMPQQLPSWPPTLVHASIGDPRVACTGVLRWAERLRAAVPGAPLWLDLDPGNSHFADTSTEGNASERAIDWAFLMHAIGQTK